MGKSCGRPLEMCLGEQYYDLGHPNEFIISLKPQNENMVKVKLGRSYFWFDTDFMAGLHKNYSIFPWTPELPEKFQNAFFLEIFWIPSFR